MKKGFAICIGYDGICSAEEASKRGCDCIIPSSRRGKPFLSFATCPVYIYNRTQ